MTPDVRVSHAEASRVLRRVGYPPEVIKEILAQLADPIDPNRDSKVLERYGVTREHLMGRMGASP
jgi:hypothetical protein